MAFLSSWLPHGSSISALDWPPPTLIHGNMHSLQGELHPLSKIVVFPRLHLGQSCNTEFPGHFPSAECLALTKGNGVKEGGLGSKALVSVSSILWAKTCTGKLYNRASYGAYLWAKNYDMWFIDIIKFDPHKHFLKHLTRWFNGFAWSPVNSEVQGRKRSGDSAVFQAHPLHSDISHYSAFWKMFWRNSQHDSMANYMGA